MPKKIFVSGCYDMLHSGHVAFFEEAAQLGDLYVGIGSDNTVFSLKGRKTINSEQERLYMVKSLKAVKDAFVNSGDGLLDFADDVKRLKPDTFFVNEDGASPDKERFCRKHNIEYVVSKRIPHGQLPARSTTALRQECNIPYRIDLAGGWLDQPYVSKFCAGSVITICIEPDYEFNDRSGMATSSRKKAIEMWQTDIPAGDKEKLAKTLFCFENPPGTSVISGSQDALGIVMPGLNRYDYDSDFWPQEITSILDENILAWIENHLYLIPLSPRKMNYDVLANTNINEANAQRLSIAANDAWNAILKKDIDAFAKAFTASFEAQITMFPNMVDNEILQSLEIYKKEAAGWKLSGAGGGGYFILVAKNPRERKGMKIKIRR
ncbi:MAG: adenylyltransferase/cytidyltransferase family protein [Bacteroidales bacterium]|jgi:cytidyltransferase-like protein|nr:adenylyltransferase/cytidyltransferase family protein [Bacteroidales bacterium]